MSHKTPPHGGDGIAVMDPVGVALVLMRGHSQAEIGELREQAFKTLKFDEHFIPYELEASGDEAWARTSLQLQD
jgi:hypothetical protein